DELIFESTGEHHPPISLPNGAMIKSKGKLPWSSYPKYLRNGDIGLALMCSPHPSHLPLEMAAAGMQVVTNSFASKDLNQLSPNIHSCSLNIECISKALNTAFDSPALSQFEDLSPLGPNMNNMLDDLERAAVGGVAA
ncbi:MAG: rhamnosyltransferase WsaF family glycosyltransferase, partial [Planktomarina sp.]